MSLKKEELLELQRREANYEQTRDMLVAQAKEKFGETIFSHPGLPEDFDIGSLTEDYFTSRYDQQTALPFSDKAFQTLTKMEKRPLNTSFAFERKGKLVSGTYLVGRGKDGEVMLFALSVVRDTKAKNAFNIKLDFCPQGKEWINLVRLDSEGNPHPNYIVDGKVVRDLSQVQYADTPHVHRATEQSQVLFHDGLDYTPAKDLSETLDLTKSCYDNAMFIQCMDYFMEHIGLDATINPELVETYDFSPEQPLLNFDDMVYEQTVEDIGACLELEEEAKQVDGDGKEGNE